MKKYESVVMFNPNLSEQELYSEAKRFGEAVLANGATKVEAEDWGKRELAFKIAKQRMGHFVCFMIETENSGLVSEIERLYSISDSVMRYQTFAVSDRKRKIKGFMKASALNEDSDSRNDLDMQ